MKFFTKRTLVSIFLIAFSFCALNVVAQNKVVVVPLDSTSERGSESGDLIGVAVVRISGGNPVIIDGSMPNGGTPTVERRSGQPAGQFLVFFPGEPFSILSQPAHVTLFESSGVRVAYLDSISGSALVKVVDASGANVDPFGFTISIYKAAEG